ncbi:hypothetical protein WICMUC_000375 [Wickerhamomyces mucosus]|uniref:Photolyase/cryptochrome alpha/beta domain-containing protein n=1 Tax=Wickerhamomyces mucosus TaxID=1378264 RepID=A0A9P8PXJ8_9ASCO|nr:hypothetical protein WICMUC_000375 [Wickerhamomyces mucosus]
MSKRIKLSNSSNSSKFWENFIKINPNFYNKRLNKSNANKFNNGERIKPFIKLEQTIESKNLNVDDVINDKSHEFIIHWFRQDLRIHDNIALINSINLAKKFDKKLLTIYIFNEIELKAHFDSSIKLDFIKKSLNKLRKDLNELNIPLKIITLTKLGNFLTFNDWLIELVQSKLNSSLISINLQYEYDELNRDIKLIESLNILSFHEQCIIKPFQLQTGKGSQYSKFTPWFKNWSKTVLNIYKSEGIQILETPSIGLKDWDYGNYNNDEGQLSIEFQLDSLKKDYYKGIITDDDLSQLQIRYEAGEEASLKTFNKFLKDGIFKYIDDKDSPLIQGSSHLSHHLTQGTISIRFIVLKLIELNKGKIIGGGNANIENFIKEIAWREFFRHFVCNWPYTMMYIPAKLSSLDLKTENNLINFQKWCLGETGFPIIDASMKELLKTGYMNNRCRMISSSFLSKDLNIDYRIGELWFHYHLIDGDFISNNQGWQWSSSTGLDSQPWFRIFNVYLQSEKFDKDCKYIWKWLPELKQYTPKQIHYADGLKQYYKPCINRDEVREETLERYREAFA